MYLFIYLFIYATQLDRGGGGGNFTTAVAVQLDRGGGGNFTTAVAETVLHGVSGNLTAAVAETLPRRQHNFKHLPNMFTLFKVSECKYSTSKAI